MTYWIGTGWKMNKTLAEAQDYARRLAKEPGDTRIQRFVIPPFTAARQVKEILRDTNILVGAQNMHWKDEGSWTGEISPVMLKDCGLDMVELGHSERRAHFGETDIAVGLKLEAALRHGLLPLVCIGETREEREAGRGDAALVAQVEGAVQYLDEAQKKAAMLFAYEPVWAIGEHGIPATGEYVAEKHALIGKRMSELLGHSPPVLYGGSVNSLNCEALFGVEGVGGLFIGRSAWTVEGYLDILGRCARVK